jgi:hypothetical protein
MVPICLGLSCLGLGFPRSRPKTSMQMQVVHLGADPSLGIGGDARKETKLTRITLPSKLPVESPWSVSLALSVVRRAMDPPGFLVCPPHRPSMLLSPGKALQQSQVLLEAVFRMWVSSSIY